MTFIFMIPLHFSLKPWTTIQIDYLLSSKPINGIFSKKNLYRLKIIHKSIEKAMFSKNRLKDYLLTINCCNFHYFLLSGKTTVLHLTLGYIWYYHFPCTYYTIWHLHLNVLQNNTCFSIFASISVIFDIRCISLLITIVFSSVFREFSKK